MQHKWTVLLTMLVLFSVVLAPLGAAHAAPLQGQAQDAPPSCPPYVEGLLQEQELLDSLPEECIRLYKETARQSNSPEAERTEKAQGPDGFGYTYHDAFPYNWISATTNSGLSGDDRFTGPLALGFDFPFYGLTQSQLYFNTNGLITFGSGSADWGDSGIGDEANPNNLIAPFWADLLVGSPYNNGGVFYSRGGSAPNRYFVVEWRNVEWRYRNETFTFEAILHENGDIVFQYASLPSLYMVAVGLEDSIGYNNLEYLFGSEGLFAFNAIRFYYPTTPTRRVLAYAPQIGGFIPINGQKDFLIRVTNTGTAGTDVYNVMNISGSDWPFALYAADGVTPLTDTNSDIYRDTGPVAQGTSTDIVIRYSAPAGAQMGAATGVEFMVDSTSSAYASVRLSLSMAIPTGFAQVFRDNADGAMSLLSTSATRTDQYKVTENNYAGSNVAMAKLPNGNYFYAWDKGATGTSGVVRNIEYVLLNGAGQIVRPVARLTDNTSASIYTSDSSPSVAVAPNGTVGVLWVRYQHNRTTNQTNYNVFFSTLSTAGARLAGPINITNNTVWDGNLVLFGTPTVAATSDNRFIMGWTKTRQSTYSETDVWYAVRNASGAGLAPAALTTDGWGFEPVLNTLTGGRAIITWQSGSAPRYAVLDSNGAFVKNPTSTGDFFLGASSLDAVQLSNGKVFLAFTHHAGIYLVTLNSSYSIEGGIRWAETPFPYISGDNLSVTMDAANHLIMTWVGEYKHTKQLYALADSNGTFLTAPMVYRNSGDSIDVSWNGQGNAPYVPDPVISGNAGVAGAALTYPGGSATADGSGTYSFKVPRGWSGTVTPSKTGYLFSPTNRTYTNVTTDQAAQHYTATLAYAVSGDAGASGVTLSYTDGTPRTVTSQLNGSYSFIVPIHWTGAVTPTHPCFTFSPASRNYNNLTAHQSAQDYTPAPISGCASIDVSVGGASQGRFGLLPQGSTRVSFPGLNSGPVKIASTNAVPVIGAERLVYRVNNVNTSFTEMMGLPASQLDTIYWLPWYNNVELDTQLRFANVSGSPATVHVLIGGNEMTGSPFTLAVGESTRKSFPGVNAGPVQIVSDAPIVAAERLIYRVNNVAASFSETMAVPDSQLDTTYWLPWYNNVELDTQLRFANVSGSTATVHVFVGGAEMTGSPFTLLSGASTRKSFPGINAGPVKIVSDHGVPIVAAERLIYKVNNVNTSFTEMMAQPNSQLDSTYWLPWYNNNDLDTQLRFANVHDSQTATVHVYIGGVEMAGSPFTLLPGASTRKSFPGINAGPVQIVSDAPIVAAERLIYRVNNIATSFSEMLALPNGQLDTTYWLPWYNNVDLDTQLRFGVP